MPKIKVISKETHNLLTETEGSKVALSEASVVVLKINKNDVLKIEKNGTDAIVTLKTGEQIVIENFFNNGDKQFENSLVLEDDQHKLLWVQFTDANGALLENITYGYIESIEPLLYSDTYAGPLAWAFIPATAGGILWWAGNRNKDNNDGDTTAPTKPTSPEGFIDNQGDKQGTFSSGTATDDSTPGIIIGPIITGETPNLIVDGVKVPSIYDPNTGTLTPVNPLPEGSHEIRYTITDPAGNSSEHSDPIQVIVDTIAPTQSVVIASVTDDVAPGLGNVVNNGATNDTTPLLGGTISAVLNSGEQVVILRDGAVVGTATVTGTTWTFADAGLTDGRTYIYTARVEDAAGNRGAISTNYSISVDTIAPTQTVVISNIVDNVAPQIGNVLDGGVTNDVTPELQGTISTVLGLGEVVAVYRDGGKVGTATVTNSIWTFADTGLADGVNYVYTARVEDVSGNQGLVSNDYSITVDTSAPTQSVVISTVTDDVAPGLGIVANNGATNDTTPLLGGTISAILNSGEQVVVLRDGAVVGTATVTGTTWTFADAGLTDGRTYIYTARVEDGAGNRGAISSNYSISVDTSAPTQTTVITTVLDNVAPGLGTVANGGTTNDTTPELQGTISTVLGLGEVVAVYRDGVKVGTATVTNTTWTYVDSSLASGSSYTYTARVEDAAGNTGNSSSNYNVTIETGGPTQTTTIIAVQDDFAPQIGTVANNGATNDTTPVIEGQISAALNVGESVIVLRDGVVLGKATVAGTTWTYNDTGLSSGSNYTYTSYVENAAFIQGGISNSYTITVDTDAPTQTTIITTVVDNVAPGLGNVANGAFTNDDTPSIEGTISATLGSGEVVAIYRDGVKVGTATVTGTTWTFADAGLASGSSYTYTARVEDAAGNQGLVSNNYAISVDTSGSSQSVQILSVIDDVAPQTGVVANNGATNDISPQLTGSIATALTGTETVVVLRDNVVIGTATVTGTTWAFNDSGLSNGNTYVYTTRVETAGGNQSPASAAYTITVDTDAPTQTTVITQVIDNFAPQTGIVANNGSTNDVTPSIEGTISATLGSDEVVVMYRDGVKVGTAIVTGTTWIFADAGLVDGNTYIYAASLEDAAGNQGLVSNNYAISVDTSAPSASNLIQISAISTDTGISSTDFLTNDTTLTVSGTLTSALSVGEKVQVSNDGGTTWIDAITTGTTWSLVDATVHSTNFSYLARVVDDAGNVGSTDTQAIVIDTVAPTQLVTITNYTDDVGGMTGNFNTGSTTDDRTPVLNGTVNSTLGAGEQIAVYQVNGGNTSLLGYANTVGTAWTYEISSNLSDGQSYTYYASVVDAAGNLGPQSNNLLINIDLTVNINTQNTLDITPIISGSTGFKILPGEYLEVTVNGQTYSSQTGQVVIDALNNTWYVQIPNDKALPVGTYNVVATLKEATGLVITQDDTANELVVAPTPVVTVGAGGGDPDQKGTAVTIGQEGVWRIHTNQTMLDANGTSSSTLGSFSSTAIQSNDGGRGYDTQNYVQNATFIDFNRDGLMDLFAVDNRYDDGQQMFYYNGTTYTAYQVGAFPSTGQPGGFAGDVNTPDSANTWSWYGGIMAIDKNGDGLVDMIIGDQTPNDSAIRGGYGSQIVLNNDGTVFGMSKDGHFATDYATIADRQPIGPDQSQPDMELSGVDINNDGIVDFAMHSQNIVADGSRISSSGALSDNNARLVIAKGTNTEAWNVDQIIDNVFQRGTDDDPGIGNGVAMTWADFNGDGYMDLFLGRGSESDTAPSRSDYTAEEYASRIYFNDGAGKLIFSDPNGDGIGNPTAAGKYVFSDKVAGGASIALDWNHDGKMDVIELPGMGNSGGVANADNTGPINLYTNTTAAGVVSFTTTNLLTEIGKTTIGTSAVSGTNSGPVTGAVAIDIDWDGDRDLLAFTVKGQTTYIENKNNVAYGTSIHLRILDEEGINSLYGNTVQLVDEATGRVVSTQMINAQSGNQTNDSTGIVDFYNLDASKTYSAVILRQKNNAAADVGGVTSVGSNTVEIVNTAWAGLKAKEANHAYVLTTEAADNVANANKGNGIVGTGYNDTFFATLGNDIYNGSGGTTTISGIKSWSNTGGLDIIDYKLAGSTPLVVDLSILTAQNTGFGTVTLKNIEGVAGGSGIDTLSGNALNNYFDGRGGNDIFDLSKGGQDTLMYKLLNNADATGGNGSDIVNGFTVGTVEATPNADIIDIKDLLVGYTADLDGAARYINGVATIDTGDTIANYISVTQVGNNSVIGIDRDGAVGGINYTTLATLNNVRTDLETLLANHQITIG